MEYRTIPDTFIAGVDPSAETGGIIFRDGERIDFKICARNYQAAHPNASVRCIGERKMDEGIFVFYTSGVRTKIVFDKMYVGNFLRRCFLSGSKNIRFLGLQHDIIQTGYTTRDLS